MTINFFHRLSFRLARTSLIIVLLLGLCVTFLQVYLDFRSANRISDQTIKETIQVSHSAAARAVFTLDPELAIEVTRGLITYPFVLSVKIFDEDGHVMAHETNPSIMSSTSKLTAFLKDKESTYEIRLIHSDDRYEGKMSVTIDNDQILTPLYKRAFYTFITGITRNILLGLVLAIVFHLLLTRPLFQVASNISKIDYRAPEGKRIPYIPRHNDDEIGFIVDSANALISQLESHQLELVERETQLRIILNASPNQVFAVAENGEIIFSNITISKFYQLDVDDLKGENYFELLRKNNPSEEKELIHTIEEARNSQKNGINIEQQLTGPNDKEHVMQMTLMPFTVYGQSCTLIIATDISDRVAAEERIERLAYYDSLTSLPNRNHLHEQLIGDIEYTKEHNTHGAVLFIDIDDFKRINDTLGHSIGDELLLHLSNKMKSQLRSRETLARLGGDEFILSVPDIDGDEEAATKHATHLAERLLNTISAPIELGSHFFSIGASIGIAIYPTTASNVEQLLRYADTAMYQAKTSGRCYRVFEAPMEEAAHARVRLESELRQAIANQEFRFHLQPLINAATHRLVGAEALIRWEHPEKGIIMPGEFIPFLEQSPMVSQVGAQLLDQVCGFLHACQNADILPPDFRISVNISATEFFQPNFVEHIRTTLHRHQLEGNRIELEITESVALENLENVINKMFDLKRNGITFALDDFGTGFSSLNYLKKLPVDKIKIDKTFIDDVPTNKQDSSIVASVIDIAENLNLGIVVEGVEEKIQADYFGLMENITIQGYWFDAPLVPSVFVDKYLKNTKSNA